MDFAMIDFSESRGHVVVRPLQRLRDQRRVCVDCIGASIMKYVFAVEKICASIWVVADLQRLVRGHSRLQARRSGKL